MTPTDVPDEKFVPEPVSAPPTNPEASDSQRYIEDDATYHDVRYSSSDTHRDRYVAAEAIARAAVPTPFIQQVMYIRNRQNWKHYYMMPASVGIQNIPRLVDEMLREGVQLEYIEIVFENSETKL